MIAKELDPFSPTNDYERAGRMALEQTARCLKGAFGRKNIALKSNSIHVLNDLRLEYEQQSIPIDHLILHRYGFILIENRSRAADIEVNAIGQWTQIYKGSRLRIPAPTDQAERKLKFLKRYLIKQGAFLELAKEKSISFHYLVTISEEGIFEVPEGVRFSQVCKVQQVPQRITMLVKHYHKANRSLFRKRALSDELSSNELTRLSIFLRQHHKPLQLEPIFKQDTQRPKAKKQKPTVKKASQDLYDMCQSCGKNYVYIEHVQGEYQFKCSSCKTVSTIQRDCSHCSERRYIRKAGNAFYLECEVCQTSRLLYINPTN